MIDMMRPVILSLMAVLLFVSTLSGQTGFRPGYIINNKSDTIRGTVDDRGEVQNSTACLFRASDSSEPEEFLPGEIAAYRFDEGKYYVAKFVGIDGEQQLVFAECLVKGTASLYYFRNKGTELYLIEKDGEKMLALTYTNNYISLLKGIFSDCPEIQSSIDRVKLNHRSLKSITCQYNAYVGADEPCVLFDQGSRVSLHIGPVIGFTSSQLALKGDELFESFEFKNSNDPALGLVLELSSDRLGNHLSFQLGSELSKNDFHSSFEETSPIYPLIAYHYDATLQSLSLAIFTGASYSFTTGRIRPGLGGGLMFHKFIQPDFSYVLETNDHGIVTIEEWRGDVVNNWIFGAYLQAGVEMDLARRLVFFAHVRGGYGTSNPNTITEVVNSKPEQIRIVPALIPVSFSIGLLF
jgi:hypothetical protein